ncbi:hypothetical protein BJ912DRAFT_1078178 [Pholiota molesta]|nr:hypothetical protein BJ912DRAFT_1078178 [Pholiota molesta]
MASNPTSLSDTLPSSIPKLDATGMNWAIFSMCFQDAVEVKGFWDHFDGSSPLRLDTSHGYLFKTPLESINRAPRHPHRPPCCAVMTPAAHNVTPNHHQRQGTTPAMTPVHSPRRPHRPPAMSLGLLMHNNDGRRGVGNGRGDPEAGDPPSTPPSPPSSLATDTHPLPTASLHGNKEPQPPPRQCSSATMVQWHNNALLDTSPANEPTPIPFASVILDGTRNDTTAQQHDGKTTRWRNNATAQRHDGTTTRLPSRGPIPSPRRAADRQTPGTSDLTELNIALGDRGDAPPPPQMPQARRQRALLKKPWQTRKCTSESTPRRTIARKKLAYDFK